jgi:hypothetical protein
LKAGQSFVSSEKTSAGLSLTSLPLLGAMLVRSAAVELGSGTLKPPKWCTSELGRLPDRHGA